MNMKVRPAGCCIDPVIPKPLAARERDRLVAGFKALADPTRLEIFWLIAAQQEPICACDIVARFTVSQPTISHHLKVLKEAGMIAATRRGVWVHYQAEPAGVALVRGAIPGPEPVRLAKTG
ncbi:MAG: winged helix-turn-helix transcriptional regulator [Chloroflexia bacterium]|nr:winged helix-turn-helix transcriptional regulator [Chloroflexia bacterium]